MADMKETLLEKPSKPKSCCVLTSEFKTVFKKEWLGATKRLIQLTTGMILSSYVSLGLYFLAGYFHLISLKYPIWMKLELVACLAATHTFFILLRLFGELTIMRFAGDIMREKKEGAIRQKERIDREQKENIYALPRELSRPYGWKAALSVWRDRKEKHRKAASKVSYCRGYSYMFFFFWCAVMCVLFVLVVTPKAVEYDHPFSPKFVFQTMLSTFNPIKDGFYGYVLLSLFIFETLLFTVALCFTRWPKKREAEGAPSISAGIPAIISNSSLIGGVPTNDTEANALPGTARTCLMIACHESCYTESSRDAFQETLRCAMASFSPSSIFVCDNGSSEKPVDDTEAACKEVHPSIHYVYIPEGNKSHAFFWVTEFWIPLQAEQGLCENFEFAMMIDDDVRIPHGIAVPHHHFDNNGNVQGLAYTIGADSPSGKKNMLLGLQDAEYKLAGFYKLFQSRFGSTLCAHGAISVWRRDILGKKILWEHDTMFHGEDLYMGLVMHRMKEGNVIKVDGNTIVPTFAPETLLVLFRQRTKSWDLCAQRKVWSYVKELLFHWEWCVLAIKPFLILDIFSVVLDWIRPFLVMQTLFHNPFAMVLVTFVFFFISWIQLIFFNIIALWNRPSERIGILTIIMFPFYKTLLYTFRWYALMENAILYTPWVPKAPRIADREEKAATLPPVPPANCDWNSIWKSDVEEEEDDCRSLVLVNDLLCDLPTRAAGDKTRIANVVNAMLVFEKLYGENTLNGIPARLNKVHALMWRNNFESIRIKFASRIRDMLKESHVHDKYWIDFNRRFALTLLSWTNGSGRPLYMTNCNEYTTISSAMSENRRVLLAALGHLSSTRYPWQHDRLSGVKNSVQQTIAYITRITLEPQYSDIVTPPPSPPVQPSAPPATTTPLVHDSDSSIDGATISTSEKIRNSVEMKDFGIMQSLINSIEEIKNIRDKPEAQSTEVLESTILHLVNMTQRARNLSSHEWRQRYEELILDFEGTIAVELKKRNGAWNPEE